jgi:glycerol-3-phosphate acyltransferase PlsY
MGAASVFRQVGLWEGIVVTLADMVKGAVAILIAQALDVSELWMLGAGFSAFIGHNFPIFAGFRGGKGSATIMGIFFILAPKEMAIVLGIMAIPLSITRNLAFSMCVGFASIPLLIWLFGGSPELIFYSLAIVIFIGVRSLPDAKQAWPKLRGKKI